MIGADRDIINAGKKNSIFEFDFTIFFAMVALMIIGVMFIYSSGINSSGTLISNEYINQIIWITSALLLYFAAQIPQYGSFQKWAVRIYVLNLALLIFTLLFGREVNGARSWLGLFGFGIQPSEFMKISLILMLASFYRYRSKELKSFLTFAGGLGITLLPMLLILLQPDMGTSLVYIPIFLAVSFVAGVNRFYLAYFFLFGFTTVLFSVLPVWEMYILQRDFRWIELFQNQQLLFFMAGIFLLTALLSLLAYRFTKRKYFIRITAFLSLIGFSLFSSYFFRAFLRDYQIMRLIVFIKPEVDPRGSGWNIIQSLTAVGSGGFWGKGFLQGTQSHYQFLPQQSTDFIFSILAEEWGFVGSLTILILFGIILVRGFVILLNAADDFGVYVGTGILFMIFFHVVINIGMAVGIMPITGIPLFFLSYGGSSLWTATIGLALIQNIYLRRYKY